MSIFHDFIPEVISIQKRLLNEHEFNSQRLRCYGQKLFDSNGTKHNYRYTSIMTGHPTFYQARNGVPERAVGLPTDWSLWSAELGTAVEEPYQISMGAET